MDNIQMNQPASADASTIDDDLNDDHATKSEGQKKMNNIKSGQHQQLPEIYMENIRLNERLRNRFATDDDSGDDDEDDDSGGDDVSGGDGDSGGYGVRGGAGDNGRFHNIQVKPDINVSRFKRKKRQSKRHSSRYCKLCTWKAAFIILLFAVLLSIIVYLLYDKLWTSNNIKNSITEDILSSKLKSNGLLQAMLGESGNNHAAQQINVGMRNDFRLQECQGTHYKQTFPDVDYAFFGYNVLKGYPLTIGHDPGFTYPIFTADYSEGRQSADCRYSIPRGLAVAPDVSCVTSFTSKIMQTKYEFSKSLSVSADASGSGWGVSFSASAGYKEASSKIASAESVFILSSAKCVYYFSKLVANDAPRFSKSFLKWVYKLNSTDKKDVYMHFFETYGTHFLSYVTFGARFIYEHKMNSDTFQSESSNGVNVAAQASYSGKFSVGGGFSMDSSQRQSASDFLKKVETKTITVGAPPPANGDALTWTSTVKESPVPMEYKLTSIETLFSEEYMKNINVDYKNIAYKIESFKSDYCKFLRESGELDSCVDLKPGIVLSKTKFQGHFLSKVLSYTDCIDYCLEHVYCSAISYCKTCPEDDQVCYMYAEKQRPQTKFLMDLIMSPIDVVSAIFVPDTGPSSVVVNQPKPKPKPEWESIVFVTKIKTYLESVNTAVIGNERRYNNTDTCINSRSTCQSLCVEDVHCVAYTYGSCSGKLKNCRLYSKNWIKSLKEESGTTTYFIFHRERNATSSDG